jgi:hypothetical protein
MDNNRLISPLAWLGVLMVVAGCLWPVWRDWNGSVVAPFGGIDAMLQLGLLEWTARHWHDPATWVDLPIFHPVTGALGFMDSLLGQAGLVMPVRWLLKPTAAGLYNWAFLGSLLAAAGGAAVLWRATGGTWRLAGVFALALVGAPYTQSQIGHLNQLPPPLVPVALAAAILALRSHDEKTGAFRWWWLLGASLVLQAAWGWYGFAHALLGVASVKIFWLVRHLRGGAGVGSLLRPVVIGAFAPAVLTAVAVLILAQPQLKVSDRYESFTRETTEVRAGSADIQHVLNRGVYRGEPADWIGRGTQGIERYDGRARQVLNPGWVALALAVFGWLRRRDLDPDRRIWGRALLVMGLVGMVLAFGESVGVPGTDRRLPLPLEWLRTMVPPFKAFRGAWRFSWLMTIAVAWWAAAGVEVLMAGRRRIPLGPAAVAMLILVSLPMGVPSLSVGPTGRPYPEAALPSGPVATVPAPENEYVEDITEALWLTRALAIGRPVTGGASGWVPPEIIALRTRLKTCEEGGEEATVLFDDWRSGGVGVVEIALRRGDPRVAFWQAALEEYGARRIDPWPREGYETWCLDRNWRLD